MNIKATKLNAYPGIYAETYVSGEIDLNDVNWVATSEDATAIGYGLSVENAIANLILALEQQVAEVKKELAAAQEASNG
jgi:hypothetical protein